MIRNFFVRRSLSKRRCAFLLASGLTLGAAGCYGPFPLTKIVYDFNGDVTDSKIVHTLLMWGLLILPVYEIAMLADAIIFNLVEFWTGETLDTAYVEEMEDRRIVLEPGDEPNEALLTIEKTGAEPRTVRFVRGKNNVTDVFDSHGKFLGQVTPRPGTDRIVFTDAEGSIREVLHREDLARLGAEV